MSRYIVNGGQPIKGEVSIRGAKNASYKQIIASLLSNEKTYISNIPHISDVHITESIAQNLGSQIDKVGEHSIEISTPKIKNFIVPKGTGEKSRTSFIFAAPLLTRTGQAIIPFPGGDKLGARPLDRLFDCFRQMNIDVEESNNQIHFRSDSIKGTNYEFVKPTHTVTEVIIMTAVLAQGDSIIKNAAQEPEIDDLILMLNSMGAKIRRSPSNPGTIEITGVSSLHGTQHQVIADRNESITFACAALSTKGSVNILRIDPKIIETFLITIEKMGAKVIRGYDEVSISWVGPLKAIDIETGPEPGFMTDWQAVFSLVLTQSVGCSTIIERIFPSRFQHINTLNQMGAKTKFFNPQVKDPSTYYHFNPESDDPKYFHGVKIYGPSKLKAMNIEVNDLRAGATATLAALTAIGESTINGVEFIERGYEKFMERLKSLGADIKYIKT
ncbi:UDP-N-acetylglucosamine 1-carboxyvinyltransferase [Candidatus Shapirobacteria bacterium RIFOXYD1_FULL_38_32]|uniref:UDP-N-acetylglucosamine 1-carboxyvinyltransferase n=2 Tax=Candidatus Shapironibacteriota TaxID=1752721 RepID=A0A1F7SV48_9BACT|nr:MAG: UDP-N-acetylglucosamine 1-carboxyvinyltransferase [Candidatus Shapirobacteria bacterium RIFOXYA1_FULL_39_17]OGL57078.1 MAG: UDP-N-acetylglucosamine 1-carboxyvinyltransferase [Candidatus Shapirobacteria bacterium RIFOXYB1_FULL_38_38]OGL57262.1 MAG: UDP-N-acetylglucosamine 1-carboxyvinyltransferase [Candidatus Shapirobacteria bacterium RIFOXYC1_FULL_38_24]OGL57957.1 MAG: UDP-N-acetylglucosamine 1-carboxyvinyltransferase [Candidatus Shapirobacteria bacterium RIFOXYD1_FULL_38_32]